MNKNIENTPLIVSDSQDNGDEQLRFQEQLLINTRTLVPEMVGPSRVIERVAIR